MTTIFCFRPSLPIPAGLKQEHPSPPVASPEASPRAADENDPTRALVARVEAHLSAWVERRPLPGNLRAALRYSLLGGGKRVRPRLALLAARAVGGELEAALPAAGAIELVHTFSLVHDDLPAMDDDDLRRGRPTLHKHAGEAMAILAGDAMLALAFELLCDELASPATAAQLCRELAVATNDMIAGQVYDTLPDFPPGLSTKEQLETIHRHKTLALIRCAARMGAISGGASADALAAVTRYAEAIGLMFQIVDDILDVTQTTEHLGKRAHKDADQGKLTYPGHLGLEGSRREVERLDAEARAALAPLGAPAAPLVQLAHDLAVRTR
jgi:geranylgeranyl diphosphate synthase type II